jgi:hypothetical protein
MLLSHGGVGHDEVVFTTFVESAPSSFEAANESTDTVAKSGFR